LFRRCGAQARAAELAELLKAEQSKSAQRQDRIQEQEGALNVLKAEFAQRHTERETLREKVEQLEKENKLLIQRFIDYKNMEAERMNEITDMYELARRKSTIDESKKVQTGLATSPRHALLFLRLLHSRGCLSCSGARGERSGRPHNKRGTAPALSVSQRTAPHA
jgi:uncharacterized protein YfkK (UPF0435 family)